MAVNSVTDPYAAINGNKTTQTANQADAADRFLKLLVAQMQNQDPLSPMDNAQVTSQMAQISTVTGIDKLNTTVQSLSSQFVQMQALQSASLVGSDVIVPGKQIAMTTDGTGQGAFALTSAADNVKVEVLSAAGIVVDTMNLGAQGSGMNSFTWKPPTGVETAGTTFRLTATSGATKLDTTALMRDKVVAINTSGDTLMLELQKSGTVAYSDVQAFN
jgi:flagellar basal-body rod modification protein FlgD